MASVSAAVDVMLEETWRREALWRNNDLMRQRLKDAGFNTGPSETPIIPAVVGEDLAAFATSNGWGYMDRTGAPVISPQYESAGAFAEGLAPVRVYIRRRQPEAVDEMFLPVLFCHVGLLLRHRL